MADNGGLFDSMPVHKAVRIMAVPTIIGQLIILIYNMADTFFIGRTDNPYMVAAASLVLPVFNMALPIAGIAGIGGGSLLSRLLGEKKEFEAKRVYSFCVCFSLVASFLFSLAVFIFLNPLLNALGAGKETFSYARSYALCVIVAGGIPTIMTNVFSSFVRSVGESKKAAFGVTMGGIINIVLDPLFMFVLMPKGKEITGAGIATCLSNVISCIYFIIIIKRLGKKSVLSFSIKNILPEKSSVAKIFSVGVPSAIATLLFDLDYIIVDKLMSGYGDFALAAVGIVLKAERLPLNVGIGICQGMVPIVAYNYASKNYKRMKDVSRFSLFLGIGCSLLSILLYELFAPNIMRFFIGNAETIRIGTNLLRVRTVATLLMFLSFFHVYLFNGYGKGKQSLILGISRWALFNIPMLFILNKVMGMYGLVWAQIAGDILTVTLSVIVHRLFVKREKIY